MTKDNLVISNKQPLIIFKSDNDRKSNDITLMSNFFDSYIQQLCIYDYGVNNLETIKNISTNNINLINEALQKSEIVSSDDIILVPDFDNLPNDIKENLKNGKYKIGTSNQVEGNLRAVILNEKNTRIKDITLKKRNNNIINSNIDDKLSIQMQMKNIYNKLIEIQDLQEYQIENDRNRDIIVPFLDARDKIIKAENIEELDIRKKILIDANDDINHALNSLYANMITTSKALVKCIDNPLKRMLSTKNKYMEFIIKNMQLATKYIGVQMQLLDYLDDSESFKISIEKYNNMLINFFTKPISKNSLTVSDIMQDNFPYSKENMNAWINMKKNIIDDIESKYKNILNKKDVYVITFEESEKNKNE